MIKYWCTKFCLLTLHLQKKLTAMKSRKVKRENERYILLVEDSQDDIDLVLLALKQNNIKDNVVIKSNGREALKFLQELPEEEKPFSKNPTLILLDINMPELNGLEVLKKIREQNPARDIPVVMLSSSDEKQDIAKSYEFGANSYIRKPVDFEEFINAVKHVGAYWLNWNRTVSSSR